MHHFLQHNHKFPLFSYTQAFPLWNHKKREQPHNFKDTFLLIKDIFSIMEDSITISKTITKRKTSKTSLFPLLEEQEKKRNFSPSFPLPRVQERAFIIILLYAYQKPFHRRFITQQTMYEKDNPKLVTLQGFFLLSS